MFVKRQHILETGLNELIRGCIAGKRTDQKRLYDMFAPKMLTLCLRYAKNQEEAEEILQDGFLQMYRNMGQYKSIGSFEGWLRKIMINCALMLYRGKVHLHSVTPLTEDHEYLTTGDDLGDRLGEKELIRLIQKLPPSYRMVFNLYAFEGMKHREIAGLLNISEGTSKSNLSDARTILRRLLAENLKAAK